MEEFQNEENVVINESGEGNSTEPENDAGHKKKCQCAKANKIIYAAVLFNIFISFILVILTSIVLFKVSTPKPIIINGAMQPEIAFKNEGQNANIQGQKPMQQAKKAPEREKPLFGKGLFGNNFKTYAEAEKSDKKMFVLFYADWCPHCHRFSPSFEKLSKDRDLKKSFNFVPLNSESPETRALMEEYQVQGFPALFIVNKQTGQKTFIPNSLLFEENAVQNLKDIAIRIK